MILTLKSTTVKDSDCEFFPHTAEYLAQLPPESLSSIAKQTSALSAEIAENGPNALPCELRDLLNGVSKFTLIDVSEI